MPYPRMYCIRQKFEAPRVDDIHAEVERQLARLRLDRVVRPAQTGAITAGSPHIANIADIDKATVAHVHKLDARPFIVAAMGSHGGGTAQGQEEINHSYGNTPEYTSAELRYVMGLVVVDRA